MTKVGQEYISHNYNFHTFEFLRTKWPKLHLFSLIFKHVL